MSYADDNREWLEPYIHDIQRRMNLSHWKITLSGNLPNSDDALAQIHMRSQSRWGDIHLRDPKGDLNDLRDSVVHELLHCHFNDMETVLTETEQHFNPPTFDIVTRLFTEHLEIAVCAITRAWAETMPLPVQPTEATT